MTNQILLTVFLRKRPHSELIDARTSCFLLPVIQRCDARIIIVKGKCEKKILPGFLYGSIFSEIFANRPKKLVKKHLTHYNLKKNLKARLKIAS